jgi:hypothetical protein
MNGPAIIGKEQDRSGIQPAPNHERKRYRGICPKGEKVEVTWPQLRLCRQQIGGDVAQ